MFIRKDFYYVATDNLFPIFSGGCTDLGFHMLDYIFLSFSVHDFLLQNLSLLVPSFSYHLIFHYSPLLFNPPSSLDSLAYPRHNL